MMFVSITIPENHYSKDVARMWYRCACETLPSGVITTFDADMVMQRSKTNEGVVLTIPLVRNLTRKESEKVKGCFRVRFGREFEFDTASVVLDQPEKIKEVGANPLIELCTAWAKRKHDVWMKEKLAAGWRYGTVTSLKSKTHPLLRQWSDLPDKYRVVDTTMAEELIGLFAAQGYVLVAKSDLDQLNR